MEDFFMAEFASKGVAGSGLGLGIAGTALGVLNGGWLGNIFGNAGARCGGDMPVNRYELGLEQKIAQLESGIALRDANIYNDGKMLELYKYVDGKLEVINSKLCDQAVFNATQTSAMNCMGGQIAQLFALTKLVIPNGSVCPGWGNVTVTPAAATTTALI
jgi:hypothetical protein